jgi:N-acetylmuramoyl-L-alanine amidase
MKFDRIMISSGHGKIVRGASGPKLWGLDEVDEARAVAEHLCDELIARGVVADVFNDDVSKTVSENLHRIVDEHNSRDRDLDVSIHFNAFEPTPAPRGVEVCYVTQYDLAGEVAAAIACCGFIDRGPKPRSDLYFLNHTDEPAILIEVCFVDSEDDVSTYRKHFHEICCAIADVLGGKPDTIAV